MSRADRRVRLKTDTEARSAPDQPAPAELLDLLWASMTDVLGTAATATLMRRAVRRAATTEPALEGVTFGRIGYDYQYTLPGRWQEKANEDALRCLRLVIVELRVLLIEITGPVVVRRLERIPDLRELGMSMKEKR